MQDYFYYQKLLQMIIFSTDNSELFAEYRKDILSSEFINEIKKFVEKGNKEKYLNRIMISRLNKIVDFLSNKKNSSFDNLKKQIKKSNDSNFKQFVSNEISKRTDNIVLKKHLNDKDNFDLYNSLSNDFNVYMSHTGSVDDSHFKNYTSLDYVVNHSYFDSLNAFYSDKSDLFNNEQFIKRMNIIFEYNNEIYETNHFKNIYIPYDVDLIKRQEQIIKKLKR